MTLLLWSEAGREELCGLYSDVMRGPSKMNGSVRPHIPPSHQNTLLIRVHLPHSITHWLYYPRRTAYSSWPWAGPGGSPELPALQSLGGRAAWSLKPIWATPWTLSLGYKEYHVLEGLKMQTNMCLPRFLIYGFTVILWGLNENAHTTLEYGPMCTESSGNINHIVPASLLSKATHPRRCQILAWDTISNLACLYNDQQHFFNPSLSTRPALHQYGVCCQLGLS